MHDYQIKHIELNVGFKKGKFTLTPFLLSAKANKDFYFIYGGGGAWHSGYVFGRNIVEYINLFTNQYVVLPSTYQVTLPNPRGSFYRRDHAQSKDNAPYAEFCHDMAFYLTLAGEQASPPPTPGSTGYMFRVDDESGLGNLSLPDDNVDVSTLGDHMSPASVFLNRVAQCETIYTDRLHVAVAGCITGRSVNMVGGSYFKNRAIFEASIKDRFPNVRFIDNANELDVFKAAVTEAPAL